MEPGEKASLGRGFPTNKGPKVWFSQKNKFVWLDPGSEGQEGDAFVTLEGSFDYVSSGKP
jgi:hypothetical protein